MAVTTTLLLVEDEILIRDILEDVLTEAGFDLYAASSGTAALAELETDAARFRALITDIRLGQGPDGWDVSRRARELVPSMAIIYISGDCSHQWLLKGVPGSMMMPKPFVPSQIVTCLSMILNRPQQSIGTGN